MTEQTKVTRVEELTYGPQYAPMVRAFGQFAVAGERAREGFEALLRESRDADAATGDRHLDEQGRTPHTVWLEGLYERIWPVVGEAYRLHSDLAKEALEAYRRQREDLDSLPTSPPPGPGEVAPADRVFHGGRGA